MIEFLFFVLYILYYIFIVSAFIYVPIIISLKVHRLCGWNVFGIEPSVIEENSLGLFVVIVLLVALFFVVLAISEKIEIIKKTRKKLGNQEQSGSTESNQHMRETMTISEKEEKLVNDLDSCTSLNGLNESINDNEDEICDVYPTSLYNPFD